MPAQAASMRNAATRGQPAALAAVGAMVRGPAPHAVLLTGPASSGKTTLARDLAAGLLCTDPDRASRPCRACRGCRLVASGNHPDLHWLAPEGPGRQIRIGDPHDPEPGTIRHFISELALLPAEGGARVAILEQAHRINEDAQNALLKLLEEPPAGVTIVLCADDEERLLPTVRSRCVRVRLGAVSSREIESWLAELGVADATSAARFARLSGGSPGLALAYARAPEAARLRGEISRGLLDMLSAARHERLAAIRSLTSSAAALDAALELGARPAEVEAVSISAGATAQRRRKPPAVDEPSTDADGTAVSADAAPKASASDRRAAASALMTIWASLARDLAVAQLGGRRQLRDPDLLDELVAAASAVAPDVLSGFLVQLAATQARMDENLNPELALDVLALAWPRLAGPAGSSVPPPAALAGRR
jgi:DNA polymerase-3 subunit delta'